MEHNIVLNEFKVTHCSLYIKKIDVFSVINFRVYLLGSYFYFISWSTLIYMVVVTFVNSLCCLKIILSFR